MFLSPSRAKQLRRSPRLGGGFTLIELVAALCILGLLVLMLSSVFQQGQQSWLHGQSRILAYQDARKTLDTIALELSQAITAANVPFTGIGTSEIRFVAPLNRDASNVTDLCEVAYWYDSTEASLIREFTPPQPNLVNPPGANVWNPTDPSGLDENFLSASAMLSGTVQQVRFEYSTNAVDFSSSWGPSTNLPSAVRVTLSVVDPATALQARNSGNAANLILQKQRTFVTIVHLINGQR